MTEFDRIHTSIDDGRQAVRDALDILMRRVVHSEDEDERRELSQAMRALHEAMVAIGDARHRVHIQKELVPYPYPMPYTPPLSPTVIFGGWKVTSGTVPSPAGQRVIATNTTEA